MTDMVYPVAPDDGAGGAGPGGAGASAGVASGGRVTVTYATALRRSSAFLLDLLLMLLASVLAGRGGSAGWAIYVVFVAAYFIGLVAEGGTVGMRLLGLRVVRIDGSRPGWLRGTIRLFVFFGSIIALGIGLFWMFDQPRAQTWQDLAADTVVVRERPVREVPEWSDAPPWRA